MHHLLTKAPEIDTGDNEYKYMLIDLTRSQTEHLASQMKYRLNCGGDYGQAVYDIGLTDDGFPLGLSEEEMELSLKSLEDVINITDDAVICSIERCTVTHYAETKQKLVSDLMVGHTDLECRLSIDDKWKYVKDAKAAGYPGFERHIVEVIIRKDMGTYWETKYGITGNVDAGKSTFLGVITSGKYDNGKGSARMRIAKHKHELTSGRTSSVSQEIIGFNREGELVNEKLAKKSHSGGKVEWSSIVKDSSKIITFFDLAGHKKYLRHTISGISSNDLDYVLVVVGANMSMAVAAEKSATKKKDWINMTKEHMVLSLSMRIPCIVVVTKIDSTEDTVRLETIKGIKKLVKSKFAPFPVESIEEINTCVDLMGASTGSDMPSIIPIIQVSNVTGEGHDILRKLLHKLPARKEYNTGSPPILQIQDIFTQVEGTATVIAGQLTSGEVHIAEGTRPATMLKIGPMSDGSFIDARVRSIHCKKIDVASVSAGKYVCLGLPKSVDGSRIKKNMFAVGAATKPQACWEFWADVKLAGSASGKVKVGHTPHTYLGHIRQTAKILRIVEVPEERDEEGGGVGALGIDGAGALGIDGDGDGAGAADGWLATAKDINVLSAGEEARMLLRWCFHPELIFPADSKRLIFKEDRTKGIGSVVSLTDTIHLPLDNKTVTKGQKIGPSRRERKKLQEAKLETALASGVIVPNTGRRKRKKDFKKPGVIGSEGIISKGKLTI